MKGIRAAIERIWYGPVYLVPVILFLFSCSGSGNNSNNSNPATARGKKFEAKDKPPSSFSDTVTINFPAAVFYHADSLQLEKIRAITDSGVFETTMHEYFYQMNYSRIVLKNNWPKIKIVEIKDARFILFTLDDGTNECIDLNKIDDPYGVIIFNRKKKSERVDMTNIDTGLYFYFGK
mgnify:CR=1 FL=1